MKQELLGSAEPWLCYACGECTASCPRDARPGEFMAAARKYAIAHHEPSGLTRLLFTSNPFSVVFMTILAVILGMFMFDIKSDGVVERWIFQWMPFNVIHDMGMVIFAFTGLSAVVGLILMSRGLFKGMPKIDKPFAAGWKAIRKVVVELGVMKRYRVCVDDEEPYFKNKHWALQPWFLHWSIMWGFLGLFGATVLDFLLKPPMITTMWSTRILGTVAGLFLMYGTTVAFVYRFKKVAHQYKNTRLADWTLLGSLWLAGLTGFWMEVAVMANASPVRDDASAVSLAIFLIHTVISMQLVLLFAFSKFAHAVYRPLALFSYFLRMK
jgi:ferredoxin